MGDLFDDQVQAARCCVCDCEILLRSSRWAQLRGSKRPFYCHNGHEQSFTAPAWEREVREAKARAEAAERKAAAAESEVKRLRRQRDGECKLCRRVFEGARGLASHMARAHAKPRALPANAGPNAEGSGYAIHH